MKRSNHLSRLLPVAALAPLCLGGCWAVAVGAGSAIVTQEFSDNAKVFRIEGRTAKQVWSSARTTLAQLAPGTVELDNDRRAARGNYDGNTVSIEVATHSLNSVELRVYARKLGFVNGESANLLGDRILDDLEDRYPSMGMDEPMVPAAPIAPIDAASQGN